ncbi:MAG: hypothetical protein JST68_27280 [Bacteroidetes bacterium]|nr:hypothetical protein [Bacteroidota bacterium]
MKPLVEETPYKKVKTMLTLVFVLVGVLIYEWYTHEKRAILMADMARRGVYTKCELVDVEDKPRRGRWLTIRYTFGGEAYEEEVKGGLSRKSIGRQYLIKVLPDKPETPLLLENDTVPACIERVFAPSAGWKELPSCN